MKIKGLHCLSQPLFDLQIIVSDPLSIKGILTCATYHGHAEVLGFFQHFMQLSQAKFRIQIEEVLAKGDRVIVLVPESARRNGREWSSPQVHAWTVKNGKATMFWQFQGDQQTEDEFWS